MNQDRSQNRLPRLLTAQEVADITKISVKTIYSYVRKGLMPYVRIQSNLRFSQDEIREWIEAHTYRVKPQGGRR